MDVKERQDTLKTTAVVGGGQIVIIIAGILKTKIAAIFLGPSGIGLINIFTTIIELIRSITSCGLPLSGVRAISHAASFQSQNRLKFTTSIFFKWIRIASVFGFLGTIILAYPLSLYIFKSTYFFWSIVELSIAVLFNILASGFQTNLQGRREMGLLVKGNIVASIFGAAISVLFFYLFGKKGIVAGLVFSSAINFIACFYYNKKLNEHIYYCIKTLRTIPHAKDMLKVGFFMVVVSVFDQTMGLILRTFITNKIGTDGLGLFSAANTLAGMYLTVILTSLSSDYFPKLSALIDNKDLNLAVNLQLNIVVLLASPIIITMVGFSDIVIRILYTSKFVGANYILQWQLLGDYFKIIAWPCGFIFLAKGLGRLFTLYSISSTLIYFLIIVGGWKFLQLKTIGLGFFISQFFGLIFIYWYCYKKYSIKINFDNLKIILIMGILLICIYFIHHYINHPFNYFFSSIPIIASMFIAFKSLKSSLPIFDKIKRVFK